ncbi:MAG: CvpA family protein [Candidatus Edwardsbacteria bacterium]|jgi:membrane protein required for colicin V production|nr:CvpA family protein [Candidatus Edwardsbacteria bacterium]
MNWVDIVIIALLAAAVLLGFKKGLVQEIAGIIALVVAFFFALLSHGAAAGVLRGTFPKLSAAVAPTIGFIVMFLAAFGAITLVGWLLAKAVKASPLDFADKLGGMAVGLFKGALVVSILLMLLALVPLPAEVARRMDRSAAIRTVRKVAPWVYQKTKGLWPRARELYQDFQQQPEPKKVQDLKPI